MMVVVVTTVCMMMVTVCVMMLTLMGRGVLVCTVAGTTIFKRRSQLRRRWSFLEACHSIFCTERRRLLASKSLSPSVNSVIEVNCR
jgi:hypothetical protein